MEWSLGITDTRPSQWKKCEPMWEDERIVAHSSHTFYDVMNKLCGTAIKKRREYDYGIHEHLWNWKITHTWKQAVSHPPNILERAMRMVEDDSDDDSGSSDGDDEDEEEDGYRRPILVKSPQEMEMGGGMGDDDDDEYYDLVPSTTHLSSELIRRGSIVECTYDYGTTTTLYLKVLSVRREAVQNLIRYFDLAAVSSSVVSNNDTPSRQEQDLKSVAAYRLPVEEQIDAFYPNFSKSFLGRYVPLVLRKKRDEEQRRRQPPQRPPQDDRRNVVDDMDDDDADDDAFEGEEEEPSYVGTAVGCATLGLSARIRSDEDTIFCTLEDSRCSGDLLFCPIPFRNTNEFLQVAELSWTPKRPEEDTDGLHRYRYDGVCRFLCPPGPEGDVCHERLLEDASLGDDGDPWMMGPKKLVFRLGRRAKQDQVKGKEKKERGKEEASDFDFAKTFPKTDAMFRTGRFRWFQYKNKVLRILVGRGVGHFHRDLERRQILRTWKRNFPTFHELLCAVEASWVWKGRQLTPEAILPLHDTFLGPSNPGPKEPPSFGGKRDTIVVSPGGDKKKLVTALAIAEEEQESGVGGPRTVLYSGHDDGTLAKWSLDDNVEMWSKQIYTDGTKDVDRQYCFCVHQVMGVAGIVVRTDPKEGPRGSSLVYTWTHAYDGYPEEEFEDRGPSDVKVWSGKDGSHRASYSCDVGCDEEGFEAHPSIGTVVFCRLHLGGREGWVDSMVVGLHCLCPETIDWDGDYSHFDLERAAEVGEGNILPFYEHSNGRKAMDTWREHNGMIQAMAVVPDKYLLSVSMRSGTGRPDAMVLWSLADPGVPLCRHDFWDPRRSLFKQQRFRLDGVVGISVSGRDVLIACEYGDRIAAVTVEDANGLPCLKLHGYGNIGNRYYEGEGFHGRMAMFGGHAVMCNETNATAWLFDIEGNAIHDKLDRRDGNPRNFEREDQCDDGEDPRKYAGRELAVGKATFPLWGGTASKKKKTLSDLRGDESDGGAGDGDGRAQKGDGGPIALAVQGKWLVAGFSNGAIARAPHLPQKFEAPQSSSGMTAGLTSCSSLPSDEWHTPVLENTGEFDEDEMDEDDGDY